MTEIDFFGKAVNWASESTCLFLLDRLEYNVLFSACISYAEGPQTILVPSTIKNSKYNYLIKTESEVGPQQTTGEVILQAHSRFSMWRSRYSLDRRMQPFRDATFVVGKGYIGSILLMVNLILPFKALRDCYDA